MVVAAVVSSVNFVVVKFCPCAVVPIITVVVIVLKKKKSAVPIRYIVWMHLFI